MTLAKVKTCPSEPRSAHTEVPSIPTSAACQNQMRAPASFGNREASQHSLGRALKVKTSLCRALETYNQLGQSSRKFKLQLGQSPRNLKLARTEPSKRITSSGKALDQLKPLMQGYLALQCGAGRGSLGRVLTFASVIPSCSFTFARVIPSCSFTFARDIPTLQFFLLKHFWFACFCFFFDHLQVVL